MKKIIVVGVYLYLLLIGLGLFTASAQKSVVKVNLAGVVSGSFGGMYEYTLNEKLSAVLGANYLLKSQEEGVGIATTNETGFNVIPEIRLYPSTTYTEAPHGIYVGANLVYEKLNIDITSYNVDSLNTSGNITNIGYGIVLGHQWIVENRFSIDLFVNPYYNSPSLEGPLLLQQLYEVRRGFLFKRLGVALGIAF